MADTKEKLSGWALGAALIILTAWLAMLVWLLGKVDAMEVQWARYLTVLSSLEAVAFAAAGALLGTTIQQKRVTEAKARADKAEGEADKSRAHAETNAKDAANGRALAAAVKGRARARAAVAPESGTERISARSAGAPAGQPADDELTALANELFPR